MPRTILDIPSDEMHGHDNQPDRSKFVIAILAVICAGLVLFFLSGCTSSKKTTQTRIQTADTTSTVKTEKRFDTASMVNLQRAKDVTITYTYDTGKDVEGWGDTNTVTAEADVSKTPMYDFVPHQGLESVTVHIGEISDSTASIASESDSGTTIKQAKLTEDVAQTVVETKTGWSWYDYMILVVVAILIGLVVLIRLIK